MRRLAPDLPIRPGESAAGYASRLALFHTGEHGTRLLSDHGVDPRAYASGDAGSVAELARLAGTSPDLLLARTVFRHARHREYRGERCARRFVRPDGTRFCPACLLEDGPLATDRYARLEWRFAPVRVCTRHGTVLAHHEDAGWGDFGPPFPNEVELQRLQAASVAVEPSRFDHWLSARIAGEPFEEGDFLAAQTVEQGAKLSLMLGATLQRGLQLKVSELDEQHGAHASALGFEIAAGGEGAVMNALDEIRGMSASTAGQAKFKAMYGNFYEWLRSTGGDTDPGPVRDLLREHIMRNTALAPGDVVLGEEVRHRRMHSAYSLSLATGPHPARLRKILVRLGLAPVDCDELDYNLLVFPVGETEEVCRDLATSIPLAGLPDTLGCTRSQAESLHRAGLLRPVVEPGDGIGMLSFSQREIGRFLGLLATFPECDPSGCVDLTRASKMTSLSTGDLLRRGLSGKLGLFRATGQPGVGALRIAVDDIRRLQAKTRGSPAAA